MKVVRSMGPVALTLCGVVGCDTVERETIDRVTPHADTAWTSREDCQALLGGAPSASRPPRIGTWNIHYFPDSTEGEQSDPDEATDIEWLACAIASLDVDVLAVQEIKNGERGKAKQAELIQRLNELTGGDFRLEVAPCEPESVQHPGFLFDERRVTGKNFREIPIMNPDPVCSNAVSPGFAGYFSIAGGPDFHFVVVHAQMGASLEGYEKRAGIVPVLEEVVEDAYTIEPDTDLLFAGDFNTIGCESCDLPVSSADEVGELAATVKAFSSPLALLPASQSCTFLSEERPRLDHFLAASAMEEVPSRAVARVAGVCEEIACGRQVEWLEDAHERLSDHCPVLLDLAEVDDD